MKCNLLEVVVGRPLVQQFVSLSSPGKQLAEFDASSRDITYAYRTAGCTPILEGYLRFDTAVSGGIRSFKGGMLGVCELIVGVGTCME